MDKILSEKDKMDAGAPGAQQGTDVGTPESLKTPEKKYANNIGGYGSKSHYAVDMAGLNKDAWEKSKEIDSKPWYKLPLAETVQGRLLRRSISRSVMGAAGFTLGGWYFSRKMVEYAPHLPAKNVVQHVAHFIDNTIGSGIKAGVNALGRDGEAFTTFRKTVAYEGYGGKKGRSLAHEAILVTGDFATMSLFDFWTRKFLNTIDPNCKGLDWRREDGSIDWVKAVKTFARNTWTGFSYSAGEDVGVAIPYVFSMEYITTPLLNRLVPGHVFDHDRNGQGGSMLIDAKSRVVGNLTKTGALALVKRFTEYNVGTLLYREAYHWIGTRFGHMWYNKEAPAIVQPDPNNPDRSAGQTVVDGAKQFGTWIMRGVIKATMYMIPSAAVFAAIRVPSHKYRGMFIHPEKGALVFKVPNAKMPLPVMADSLMSGTGFTEATPVFFSATGERAINPLSNGAINPSAITHGITDTLLSPIGMLADKVRTNLNEPLAKVMTKVTGTPDLLRHADTVLLASMAYGPYFGTKSDWLADKWDTGRTDVGVERIIKGVASGKVEEVKAGLSETRRALSNKPFADPNRELYAQCREATDDTPSDNKFDVNPNAGQTCDFLLPKYAQQNLTVGDPAKQGWAKCKTNHCPVPPEKTSSLSWEERMVKGRPPKAAAMLGGDGLSLEDTYKLASRSVAEKVGRRAARYGDQEAMRKALEEATPPSPAIH